MLASVSLNLCRALIGSGKMEKEFTSIINLKSVKKKSPVVAGDLLGLFGVR
jgi:hypothetical protein